MLARPRRWMRAALPRFSRCWTLGTVRRTTSHAVFAPEAAMSSAVITRPTLGEFDCSIPPRAPPQPATLASPSPRSQKRRRGRSTLRPPSPRSPGRPSIHDGIGHHVLHRIHWLAVHPDFVVQVRSRGEPGRADERDLLPALHALATDHEDLRAMGEPGHQPEAVIHRDHVAVALFPPHFGHDTRRRGLDLRAHRRRHVDPQDRKSTRLNSSHGYISYA